MANMANFERYPNSKNDIKFVLIFPEGKNG